MAIDRTQLLALWKLDERMRNGTAENRHYSYMDNRPDTDPVLASDLKDVVHYQDKVLNVTYESLSGRLYESSVEIGDYMQGFGRTLHMEFKEVSR